MSILPIATVPNPVLNKISIDVDSVDESVQKIMDDMLETMYSEKGIGLAANQVKILKRIIVLDTRDSDYSIELGADESDFPMRIANPKIIELSKETCQMDEGCLSLGDQSVRVTRPKEITLEYLDYNNKKIIKKFSGITARCLQHEIDHLNGITLINYLSPIKKDVAVRKIKKFYAH